jgi:hypothetical protein
MSTGRLAPNVEAYEPEADPANIDPQALRDRGWPRELVELIGRHKAGSTILTEFEQRTLRKLGTKDK